MSKEEKTLCPLGFLWRAPHAGAGVMKAGLVGILLSLFIKLSLELLGYNFIYLRELLLFSCLAWVTGKLVGGAQKRTRTSTKKNFTRT
jgi:hypothetical protein